jgi:hypothetical protein
MNALTEAFRIAEQATQSSPKNNGQHQPHIKWSESEWIAIVRALAKLFPELGLPAPEGAARVQVAHMRQAMQILPPHRRRNFAQVVTTRDQIARVCKIIRAESEKPARAPGPAISLALPTTVIYRQPDGAQDGPHPDKARVFWRESEWYSIAVELAYTDPTFLDTLNHLHAADVNRAQRVIQTSRRKPLSSLYGNRIKQELTPAFRRLRASIEAARREQAEAQSAAAAQEAERAESARQGEQEAAHQAIREQVAQSPEFIAQALGRAEAGPLLDALLSRAAASFQGMLESAIIRALSSDTLKSALVINLHMHTAEDSAKSVAANPPRVSGNVASKVIVKPKVGIVGALPQQGEILAAAYPQLRIKAIDKNLNGQSLRDAVAQCDRVIAMTGFISHSLGDVCQKAAGERYTRVDGGISSVRRQIDVWLATGALGPTAIPSAT